METKLYLVRLGEISLKGLNRPFFEKKLKNNIKLKLRPFHNVVTKQKGRLYFEIDSACSDEQCELAFSTTFGIVGYAKCVKCKKDVELIKETTRQLIRDYKFSETGTFKVQAKRSDKNFEMSSYDLSCELAKIIHEEYPNLTVDLKNPDNVLHIEIRNKAYIYTSEKKGPNGLPVTTAGKGMLLLSGGIDSPVAGYKMAARGLKMECIYFHAYPYTSDKALEKVKVLASKIAPFLQGTRLHVVPFTEQQLWIKSHSNIDETTLMFRACMMKVATMLAKKNNATCLVTGEALSQVASQTLDSMAFTDSTTDMLIIRPLVGMNKEEIMKTAEEIDTYKTSILPYEDCCVIFSPKHPLTRPIIEVETQHYEEMQIDDLLVKAVEETETYDFYSSGKESIKD
ncbi:MAG: tRNA 4-thiouridine(8) synthase ThiI [Sphaerochaetaceae bacterium]|nr:tRNA 4-thiouridine(8) synthase ThiI [Sphaerochaetaceae bacterium]MDC7249905.1 tRNA 4-thiouridine(8) synthase ThiI [Sphaerochaetaceae bacterium]